MEWKLVYNLKLEINTLNKIKDNMETVSNKEEFKSIPDEEYDIFHEHLDAINNLIEILTKRIAYYEK